MITSKELSNMIRERYYTIGKRYFGQICSKHELPDLEVKMSEISDSNGIMNGAMKYSQVTKHGYYSTFIVTGIDIYTQSILRSIDNVFGLAIPHKTVVKCFCDYVYLHELTHAYYLYKNRKNKLFNGKTEKEAYEIYAKNMEDADEERSVDLMVFDYMRTLNESKVYKDILFALHIALTKIGRLTNVGNLSNDEISKIINHTRDIDCRIEEIRDILYNPDRLSSLNNFNKKFLDGSLDYEITNEGVYINKKTGNILLKPSI